MQKLLSKFSPRGRFKKWLLFWFALIVGGYGVYFLFDLLEPERVLVTISKETTFITEPLKKNGYPDYVTYLHRQMSEGVTAENNAYITILQITGPSDIVLHMTAPPYNVSEQDYYRWLGIKPLPREGNYLQQYKDYGFKLQNEKYAYTEEEETIRIAAPPASARDPDAPEVQPEVDQSPEAIAYRKLSETPEYKEKEKIRERLTNSDFLEKPWTAKDYPEAAEWLAKQEPILAKLDELEKRPRFFAPFYHTKENHLLNDRHLPQVDLVPQVADVIAARINFAFGSGDRKNVVKDLRILFRLVNCVLEGQTFVEHSRGNSLKRTAETLLNHYIHDPNTTINEIHSIENDYKNLLSNDSIQVIDRFERLAYLSKICLGAEVGFNDWWQIRDARRGSLYTEDDASFFIRKRLNYDLMLRDANETFDRLVMILRMADLDEQYTSFTNLREEIDHRSFAENYECLDKIDDFFSTKSGRAKKLSKRLKLIDLPYLIGIIRIDLKDKMARELQMVSFALARYRIKNGKYPTDFADLKPEGISKIPIDVFAKGPCIYSSDGKKFILYSVGNDESDSGGFQGRENNIDYDDIAVYSQDGAPPIPPPPPGPKPYDEINIPQETPNPMTDSAPPAQPSPGSSEQKKAD